MDKDQAIFDLINARMDRFDEKIIGLDNKVGQLISFRAMLFGGAFVISGLVSIAITVAFGK